MNLKSAIDRKPLLGLMALTAGLLGQWLRHAIFPISEAWLGDWQNIGLIILGFVGLIVIWNGLHRSELPATLAGYIGGLFVWMGWFEFGFHYFAEKFVIVPYQATERLVSPPDLNLVLASFPILMSVLILYGLFNRQTKCNFMRWFHRNLRINPGMPTPNNGRDIARITAMETVFVVWFCYAFWLFITYFGASIMIMGVSYILWALWFGYILFRLLKISRPGLAFRYGIPVGIIGWVLIATPSHMGLFPTIWLEPFDYPITSMIALVVFVVVLYFLGGFGRSVQQPAAEHE